MIEYQNLKLEYKNNYISSKTTQSLSYMLKEYYKNKCANYNKIIKKNIEVSTNPVYFINNLKQTIVKNNCK